MNEPKITINNATLSDAQAMTIRVAIETFAMSLHQNGLEGDTPDKKIVDGYLCQIQHIRKLMFRSQK